MVEPLEPPIYTLPQKTSRAIIPATVSLLILGAIFYAGILLNISLLEMSAEQETTVKMASLGLVIILIFIGILISIRNARKPYLFYRNHLRWNARTIPYVSISAITPHKNFADKLLHTYSLDVGHKFILRHIPDETQIQSYLEQLRQFAQRQASINQPFRT